MKTHFYLSIVFFILILSCTEATNADPEETQQSEMPDSEQQASEVYDADLAERLEADQYGMHQYVFAMLKKGPNRDWTEDEAAELQRAHMNNISRMAEEGKLILAGPFLDDGEWRGIYIFDVKTIEEAKKLTESDPAIKAGSLEMELHPWYGSAAMMQINEVHNKITKENP